MTAENVSSAGDCERSIGRVDGTETLAGCRPLVPHHVGIVTTGFSYRVERRADPGHPISQVDVTQPDNPVQAEIRCSIPCCACCRNNIHQPAG